MIGMPSWSAPVAESEWNYSRLCERSEAPGDEIFVENGEYWFRYPGQPWRYGARVNQIKKEGEVVIVRHPIMMGSFFEYSSQQRLQQICSP